MLSGLSEPIGALLTLLFFRNVITQERIDYALAFVGGVMMAVALAELLPEARRLDKPWMTALGALSCLLLLWARVRMRGLLRVLKHLTGEGLTLMLCYG